MGFTELKKRYINDDIDNKLEANAKQDALAAQYPGVFPNSEQYNTITPKEEEGLQEANYHEYLMPSRIGKGMLTSVADKAKDAIKSMASSIPTSMATNQLSRLKNGTKDQLLDNQINKGYLQATQERLKPSGATLDYAKMRADQMASKGQGATLNYANMKNEQPTQIPGGSIDYSKFGKALNKEVANPPVLDYKQLQKEYALKNRLK